jgi:hypothetical protein
MSTVAKPAGSPPAWSGARWQRLLIVLAGIVAGQFVLYGPSLLGRKILLPLDLLALPRVYVPSGPQTAGIQPRDVTLSDLIYYMEPERRFAVSEFHAGRFPIWNPEHYAGVPVIWPKFSPLLWFECVTASPVILAWGQLVCAVIAGMGMYGFCRRALTVGFWPATVAAWLYPLTGFFVFWVGYSMSLSVYWLPWELLVVNQVVAKPDFRNLAKLALVTGVVLVSGRADFAGHVLLASGIFALWRIGERGRQPGFGRFAARTIPVLTLGWLLGFLLAAPDLLPFVDYTAASSRVARRGAGEKDFPPVGIAALPQVVQPDVYGSTARGSFFIAPPETGSLLESAAGAYAGVVATLLAAPLAWSSRRHRSITVLLAFLAVFALSWCLNVPGFVHLLQLPGLNLMSHNRFVFVAAFALLALAAIGLEVLQTGQMSWRRWMWAPPAILAALCVWCLWRAVFLPEPVATRIESAVRQGNAAVISLVGDLDGVRQVRTWFVRHGLMSAAWCGIGAAGWWLLRCRPAWQPRVGVGLPVVLFGELLWFACGRSPQGDPALYFPGIPALERVARSAPGRVIGYDCLPASLAPLCGLRDIRGYDGADPARLMDVLGIAADPRSPYLDYALTQWMIPKASFTPEGGVRLSPILDMFNVRYVIFRGVPASDVRPAFESPDYWVLVNSNALPRLFVPQRVETIAQPTVRLQKLADPEFNPREVGYVESPVNLPPSCRGTAEIVEETPTRIKVAARMETAGLLVLADRWDKGWRADLNGQPAPILIVNHALRGVVVPAGEATLEFRYRPASLAWGLRLAAFAAVVLLLGIGIDFWRRTAAKRTPPPRRLRQSDGPIPG